MIRINGNVKRASGFSRRRRISNQLAAFAAIMLFASTQVNAPVPDGSDKSTPANIASHEVDGDHDPATDPGNETAGDLMSQAVSSRRTSARGINFSLFLFRR